MIVAKEKRENNIAEYLLYMWQVEDIIRACNYDITIINANIVEQYDVAPETKAEISQWYENLIDMMRNEGKLEKGHLQININVIIKLNDLHSVEDITQYTKAGAFCKSCIKPGGHEKRDYYLVDILAETRAEIDREKLKNTMKSDVAFDEMTVVGQLKAVESVLDAEIRPMLHNDGGDLEVIDIQKAEGAAIDVYIRYLGACSGCSSGSGATLYAIETILQEELSPNIRVMPV